MRAGIYIRVSSAEQAEEGYSVGSQTDKLKAYCVAKDYDLYDTYIDPGFTGANLDRPGMQKLIADVKAGKIDIVLVMKLDRLSRSQKDTLLLIEDVFLKNGCEFVSVTESFDTSSPMGRAFIGILAVFAQFERERIKERVMDGKSERAKSGKPMGWMNVPIGYDYVNKLYTINDYEAAIVRRCYDMAETGCSIDVIKTAIDNEFPSGTRYETQDGKMHHATIKRIIKNQVYTGKILYQGTYYKGVHEPIITQKQFDTVQRIREGIYESSSHNRKQAFRSTHLLTGLLNCTECGGRMHAQSKHRLNDGKWYYICYSVSKTAKAQFASECHAPVIDGQTLDDIVISEVLGLKRDKKRFKDAAAVSTENASTIKGLEAKLKAVDTKIEKLMDLYLSEAFDLQTLQHKNTELIKSKKVIEKELAAAKKVNGKMTAKDAKSILDKAESIFKNGTIEAQKTALAALIERVNVGHNQIDIVWKFN